MHVLPEHISNLWLPAKLHNAIIHKHMQMHLRPQHISGGYQNTPGILYVTLSGGVVYKEVQD